MTAATLVPLMEAVTFTAGFAVLRAARLDARRIEAALILAAALLVAAVLIALTPPEIAADVEFLDPAALD